MKQGPAVVTTPDVEVHTSFIRGVWYCPLTGGVLPQNLIPLQHIYCTPTFLCKILEIRTTIPSEAMYSMKLNKEWTDTCQWRTMLHQSTEKTIPRTIEYTPDQSCACLYISSRAIHITGYSCHWFLLQYKKRKVSSVVSSWRGWEAEERLCWPRTPGNMFTGGPASMCKISLASEL